MALFRYWNRLRGDRHAPRRSDIEPADIKTLLPDTFILEGGARSEASFRLAGTRVCATYGKELKGHAFTSLWNERDWQAARSIVRHVLVDQAVAVVTFEGVSQEGRINSFELVVLPLAAERNKPRALGTLQPLMKPFWLGADPIVENRVDSFRLIDADRVPKLLQERAAVPAPPLSPAADALPGRPGPNGRRIRHLVVFNGGRP